MNLKMS